MSASKDRNSEKSIFWSLFLSFFLKDIGQVMSSLFSCGKRHQNRQIQCHKSDELGEEEEVETEKQDQCSTESCLVVPRGGEVDEVGTLMLPSSSMESPSPNVNLDESLTW